MKKDLKRVVFLSVMAVSALFRYQIPAMAMESNKAVYQLEEADKQASKCVYEYGQDSQYTVHTQVGRVTDIELHPGEIVTYIVGGETARWMVDKSIVGTTQHVYVKPLEDNISTNLIINTNSRSYRILISSGSNYTPIVSWKYSSEEAQADAHKVKLKKQLQPYDSDDSFEDQDLKAKVAEWKDRHSRDYVAPEGSEQSEDQTVGTTKDNQPFVIHWMKKEENGNKEKDSRKDSPASSFKERIQGTRNRDSRNFKYTVRNVKNVPVDLLPLRVWDNGKQTIIQMPKNNKYDLPVIYNVDDAKKLQLVNFRVRDNHIIADRVFQKARLQYSPKKYIEIVPSKDKDVEKARLAAEKEVRKYELES